ncbi:ImmA/IrrE family metallo-endopeptidase [Micromonospora zamorensis]|uniref:ImmA/IrrE family metallo-endopeptidase n=1 Tax=Micromonospora zamorensis TaxID=709883 RepID=UPI00369DA5F5
MSHRARYPYQPDSVPAPGETLRETIEALDMSQAELSMRTGLSAKHINQIVQGIATISHETAIALERATGVPASLWNSLESNYRDYLARKRERERLSEEATWLSKLPIKALRKLGAITADKDDDATVLQQVFRFFGVANIPAWEAVWLNPQADFLQSRAFDVDSSALATWLRLGELAAQRIRCDPFDRDKLRRSLPELRSLTVEPLERFLPEMKRISASCGVAVVIIEEIPGCRVSGATRWLSPQKAVLQLSLRHKRNDHLWFAFFHELGHILLHGKRDNFIDRDSDYEAARDDPKEQQANAFAGDLLIPPTYASELRRLRSLAAMRAFAEKIGVAPGIVVGRLQHDRLIDFKVGHALFERYRFEGTD